MSEQRPYYKRKTDSLAPKALKKRPSGNKTFAFKFPPNIQRESRVKFEGRHINIINKDTFQHPAKGIDNQFLGTLRIL